MINAANPISNAVKINLPSAFAEYKTAQKAAVMAANAVFQSFYILSGAKDDGINISNLNGLKKLLEEKELTDSSAYELTNTMIDQFSDLSSDGKKITVDDLTKAVKLSVAQSFSISSKLSTYMTNGKFNVSKDLISQFGYETAQSVVAMKFLDSLSEATVTKIADQMRTATARENADHRVYSNSQTTAETAQKITFPINITV